jgi:hypothetical protein
MIHRPILQLASTIRSTGLDSFAATSPAALRKTVKYAG